MNNIQKEVYFDGLLQKAVRRLDLNSLQEKREKRELEEALIINSDDYLTMRAGLNFLKRYVGAEVVKEIYHATNWDADLLGARGNNVIAMATHLGDGSESIKIFFKRVNIGMDVVGLSSHTRGDAGDDAIHYNNAGKALEDIYRALLESGQVVRTTSPSQQLAAVATVATSSATLQTSAHS